MPYYGFMNVDPLAASWVSSTTHDRVLILPRSARKENVVVQREPAMKDGLCQYAKQLKLSFRSVVRR
jgi:hypothetical protein